MTKRAAGRGSIRPRTGGRSGYEGRLRYVDGLGVPKRLEVTAPTIAEVEDKLDRAREALADGRSPKDAAQVTFDSYARQWLTSTLALAVVDGAASEATAVIRRNAVERHLIPLLGATRLVALTPSRIKALSLSLATEPRVPADALTPAGKPARYAGLILSSSARRQVIITLRAVLDSAVDDQLIGRNPAASVPVPTQTRTKAKPTATSTVDLRALLAALADDRLAALFVFLALTGARRNDAAGLRWADVHLDDPKPYAYVIGKGKRARKIPLTPVVVEALRAHKRAQLRARLAAPTWADLDVVFARRAGQPYTGSQLSSYVAGRTEAAGLRLTPHAFRHTYITHAGRAGVPLADLAAAVGHVDPRITLGTYTHDTAEGTDQLRGLVDTVFGVAVDG